MNITVKVDDVTLDTAVTEALDDHENVVGRCTIGDLVAQQIVAKLVKDDRWRSLRDEVTQIRTEMIREAIRPMVEEAVSQPFQKTTLYGEAHGQPVTMREIIIDEARKMLTRPADSYGGRESETVIKKIVREEVQRAFTGVIADQVKLAREQVADEIGDKVADAVKLGMQRK